MRITGEHPKADTAVIYYNGVNVTSICLEADSEAGWVKLVLFDPSGRPITDASGAASVMIARGRVVIGFRSFYRCLATGKLFTDPCAFARHLSTPHFSEN